MQTTEIRLELSKINLDQLHKAVLQMSNNCFEIKKLCATILVAAGTLVATFTRQRLDDSLFAGGIVIVLFFWILDAQSYFYQEKLRARMKEIARELVKLEESDIEIEGVGMPITPERESLGTFRRTVRSGFNASMLYYGLLSLLMIILAALYRMHLITMPNPIRQ